jgi:hypothetical protein
VAYPLPRSRAARGRPAPRRGIHADGNLTCDADSGAWDPPDPDRDGTATRPSMRGSDRIAICAVRVAASDASRPDPVAPRQLAPSVSSFEWRLELGSLRRSTPRDE